MGNMGIDRKKLTEMYAMMVRIREFENQAIELAKMNLTRAAIHTYNGEEAIAVGVCANLTDGDYITSTHRGHGHCIAKGADLKKMYAELMARESGYCKGRGGSMHIADLSIGMLGANGIVGGGIPIAGGAGFALKLQKSDRVVVCFFGDGASNEGSFHESLNLAAISNTPVIFVCENNQYGISMNANDSMRVENVSERANDVALIYSEFGKIVEDVRNGGGPILVEMKTYRMSGHYYGDNENYRTKEEVAMWREKDPIKRCAEMLIGEYGVTQQELDDLGREERARVFSACEEAKAEPEPLPEDIAKDVYDPSYKQIAWKAWAAK